MLDALLALRRRLDRLAAPGAPRPRLADRLARAARPPEPRSLLALDRALDEAGVHTLADARLLAHLLRDRARGRGELRGLRRLAARALRELRRHVAFEERAARRRGGASQAGLERLEELWARLARAVKVADLFARGGASREDPFALLSAPRRSGAAPQSARVAAAEYLVGRARASALDEPARRRALDQAHELLLRIGSELDRERVRRLRSFVARERQARARQGGAADPARRLADACRLGDGAGAWRAALGLYLDGVAAGDAALAGAAREVLGRLEGSIVGGLAAAMGEDRARVFLEEAGEGGALAAQAAARMGGGRDRLAELARALSSDAWRVFDLALGAGRFFDVEEEAEDGPDEESPYAAPARLIRVPYPGPVMTMDVARGIGELRHFVITDPRLVIYDLAGQRQLVHAWLAPEGGGPLSRRRGTGAVRVYVCDASGSMRGARARMRDAVLIAELNNLSVRAARGRPCVPIYFSFFDDAATEPERVDNAHAASRVVGELFRESPAAGKTDITYALVSAFAAIRHARGRDADLARATVVLITDGEDRVDLPRVWAARAPLGEVEITLSILSLGRGNEDLKGLVDEQRRAGRRAFHYHLDDDEVAGGPALFDSGLRTLLPWRPPLDLSPDDAPVKAAVEAVLALAEGRRVPGAEVSPALRFESYFAVPAAVPGREPPPGEVERACDLLEAVAETILLAPAEERGAEAVRLLENLQRVYRVAAPSFALALTRLPPRGAKALETIRRVGAPSDVPGGRAWG